MLKVYRLALGVDSFLDRDDMHSDSVASGRDHLSDARKGDESHALEERGNCGVLCDPVDRGVEQLSGAGDIERQSVASDARAILELVSVVVVVAVVILKDAYVRHLIEYLLQIDSFVVAVHLEQLLESVVLAELHLVGDIAHLGSQDFSESPILRVVGCHSGDLVSHSVGYLSAELEIAFIGVLVTLIFADYFLILFRHDFTSSIKRIFLQGRGCIQRSLPCRRMP